MSRRLSRDPLPRSISEGRAFVYVLPSTHEDILKVGFSRDPLIRMQTLHTRYFEYFDMQRALLIEFDSVRDARSAEKSLHRLLHSHRAPAPLDIEPAAGGEREWFRGAFDLAQQTARSLGNVQGHVVHMPIDSWLTQRLCEHSRLMFEWSQRLFAAIEAVGDTDPQARVARKRLRDAMDALACFGIEPSSCVGPAILTWYREGN